MDHWSQTENSAREYSNSQQFRHRSVDICFRPPSEMASQYWSTAMLTLKHLHKPLNSLRLVREVYLLNNSLWRCILHHYFPKKITVWLHESLWILGDRQRLPVAGYAQPRYVGQQPLHGHVRIALLVHTRKVLLYFHNGYQHIELDMF